jgi:hypothetical protein
VIYRRKIQESSPIGFGVGFFVAMLLSGTAIGRAVPDAYAPSLSQTQEALKSSDVESARLVLINLHCHPKDENKVEEVRRAWRQRRSKGATASMRDPLIQALMAECLIAGQSTPAVPDPDIPTSVALLRSAIHSDNVHIAVAAAIGLAHISEERDIQSIIDVTHRFPVTNFVAELLSFSCGPNAERTINALRDQAQTNIIRDRVSLIYERSRQQNHDECASGQ